jgi:lysophospholipase L1-like esterase
VTSRLAQRYPSYRFHFFNRGINGNRVRDLRARWQRDCIDLKPDIISIYIGINDTWRRYDHGDPTSVDAFHSDYAAILDRTAAMCDAQLILCEPFVVPYPDDRKAWREDLDPKIDVIRTLAREYGACYVPLDGVFAAASCKLPCSYWTEDGVHPTAAGHELIADVWLRFVLDF